MAPDDGVWFVAADILVTIFCSFDRLSFSILHDDVSRGTDFRSLFNWKFENRSWIKWSVVVAFIGLLSVTFFKAPNQLFISVSAAVGVFALLFVCEFFANLVFRQGASDASSPAGSLIRNVSYASMACYMFHRFFFWAGEVIWNPMAEWLKWLYMAGVIFPLMLVLSYFIQKGYDKMINAFQAGNTKM